MKLSKKIKYSLGLIGLSALAIVPASITLASCNNNDQNSDS